MLLDQPGGLLLHAAAVHQSQRVRWLPSQEDILGDGEVLRQETLLVNHRDAVRLRFSGAAESYRLTVPQHLARIGREHAGDDLHERGFARSVFTHEKMHFP